jgi:hypothetical protein
LNRNIFAANLILSDVSAGRFPALVEAVMSNFSYSIDIKRFQNLLETSVDETERRMIEKLLAEQKARADLRASEPKKE